MWRQNKTPNTLFSWQVHCFISCAHILLFTKSIGIMVDRHRNNLYLKTLMATHKESVPVLVANVYTQHRKKENILWGQIGEDLARKMIYCQLIPILTIMTPIQVLSININIVIFPPLEENCVRKEWIVKEKDKQMILLCKASKKPGKHEHPNFLYF